jgi:hypothetical protein
MAERKRPRRMARTEGAAPHELFEQAHLPEPEEVTGIEGIVPARTWPEQCLAHTRKILTLLPWPEPDDVKVALEQLEEALRRHHDRVLAGAENAAEESA